MVGKVWLQLDWSISQGETHEVKKEVNLNHENFNEPEEEEEALHMTSIGEQEDDRDEWEAFSIEKF